MKQKLRKLAIGATLSWGVVGWVEAAPKPDPTATNSTPASTSTLGSQQATLVNSVTWKKLYAQAGKPRIMIVCGIETPGAGAGGGLGANIDPFDSTGDPASLLAGITGGLLQDAPEVRLVNATALADADRRAVALLRQQSAPGAMKMICTKLKADLAFLVRMVPDPAPGVRYRMVLELVEVGSARVVGSFAFDWKLKNDAASIRMYGGRIAGKLMEQFASYARDPIRSYEVKIVGLATEDDFQTLRDAIGATPKVKEIVGDEFSSSGVQTLAGLSVRFEGGPVDLIHELRNIAQQKLSLAADAVDASYGTLTLVTHRKQRWQQLVDKENTAIRGQFQRAYADQASPRVAVLIGRGISEHDKNQAEIAQAMQQLAGQPSPYANPTLASGLAAELDAPIGRLIDALKQYDAARHEPGASPDKVAEKLRAVESAQADLRKTLRPPQTTEATPTQLADASGASPGIKGIGAIVPNSGAQAKGLSAIMDKVEDKMLDLPLQIIDKLSQKPDQAQTAVANLQQTQNTLTSKIQDVVTSIFGPDATQAGANSLLGSQTADAGLAGTATTGTGTTGAGPTGTAPTTAPSVTTVQLVVPPPPEPRRQFSNRIVTFAPVSLMQPPIDAGPTTRTPIDPDQLTAALTKRLLGLKVQVGDQERIRQIVMSASRQPIYREDQLAIDLRKSLQVQILIIGVPEISADSGEIGSIRGYGFKAIRTSDGAVLAADNCSSPIGVSPEDAVNLAADYFAGNLADQLLSGWSSSGQLSLQIANARTPDDISSLAAALRDAIPGISITVVGDAGVSQQNGGMPVCWINYRCTRDELIQKIQAVSKKLPFDLETGSGTNDGLTIRLKAGGN